LPASHQRGLRVCSFFVIGPFTPSTTLEWTHSCNASTKAQSPNSPHYSSNPLQYHTTLVLKHHSLALDICIALLA